MPAPAAISGDSPPPKAALGAIAYGCAGPDALHATLCAWLRAAPRPPRMVGYVNPHVFNIARQNPTVRAFLSEADLVAVDGLGIALGALLLHGHWPGRAVMTPLFERVLATEDLPPLTAVLVGGTDEVAGRAAREMNRRSRRIRIIAHCDGYRSIADYVALGRSRPAFDLLLVGMGTPRSEELLLAARAAGVARLGWNIGGGTVHYCAGTKPQAPPWISAAGLQWLYRMVREPETAPRYLIGIPRFCVHLLQIALLEKPRKGPRPCVC